MLGTFVYLSKVPPLVTDHVCSLSLMLSCRQLALGKRYSEEPFFKRPIVILTPKDKGSVDEEISLRLKSADLELYTRQGNPAFPQNLDMVAAKHADTVIVLVGA